VTSSYVKGGSDDLDAQIDVLHVVEEKDINLRRWE
jgi:hypothetical protein